jgi:hypothetical protein
MGQKEMAITPDGKNRIMIFGPETDGTYVVEFRTAEGKSLAISIPRTETAAIRHFQERMPHGLFVPDVPSGTFGALPNEGHCAPEDAPRTLAFRHHEDRTPAHYAATREAAMAAFAKIKARARTMAQAETPPTRPTSLFSLTIMPRLPPERCDCALILH